MLNWLKSRLARLSRRRTTIDKARNTKLAGQLVARVGAAGWPAQVSELSTNRVRVVLGRWQKQGSAIALILRNQRSGFSRPVLGSIIQVVLRSDGLWDMRCALDQPLDTDAWQALVQP
jgi:hypothetical protein